LTKKLLAADEISELDGETSSRLLKAEIVVQIGVCDVSALCRDVVSALFEGIGDVDVL
jgi:hypothetical protein